MPFEACGAWWSPQLEVNAGAGGHEVHVSLEYGVLRGQMLRTGGAAWTHITVTSRCRPSWSAMVHGSPTDLEFCAVMAAIGVGRRLHQGSCSLLIKHLAIGLFRLHGFEARVQISSRHHKGVAGGRRRRQTMGPARTHTASDAASGCSRSARVVWRRWDYEKIEWCVDVEEKKGVSELGRANHGDAGARGLLDGYSIETRLRNSRCHRCCSRERSAPAALVVTGVVSTAFSESHGEIWILLSHHVDGRVRLADRQRFWRCWECQIRFQNGVFAAQNGCILPLKSASNQRRLIRDGGESQGPLASRFSSVLGSFLWTTLVSRCWYLLVLLSRCRRPESYLPPFRCAASRIA